MARRFGFVTCVRLGLEVLEEILEVGGSVDAILTLPDDVAREKSGRVFLDDMADAHGADLLKVPNINDPSAIEWLHSHDLDWLFIIGWSQIASPEVLATSRLGTLGMHPTLLPRGRGRASIPWAILKGLEETGVTFFKLDESVDTGPILDQEIVPIAEAETASTLYEKVIGAHRELIRRNWRTLVAESPAFERQDESKATTWPGRSPEDGRIREDMSVDDVERLVRAVAPPYPGALWMDEEGRDIVILEGEPGRDSDGLVLRVSDGAYTATRWRWR